MQSCKVLSIQKLVALTSFSSGGSCMVRYTNFNLKKELINPYYYLNKM